MLRLIVIACGLFTESDCSLAWLHDLSEAKLQPEIVDRQDSHQALLGATAELAEMLMLSSEEDFNGLSDSPSQSLLSTATYHPLPAHRISQQIIAEVADICVLTRFHTWPVHLFASACQHREICKIAKDTEHNISL